MIQYIIFTSRIISKQLIGNCTIYHQSNLYQSNE